MKITLDVNQPLTAVEREILTTLLGGKAAPAAVAPTPSEPEPEPEAPVTKEDVASLAQTVMQQPGGRDKVKAALDSLGVSRVREVGADQLADFHKLLRS